MVKLPLFDGLVTPVKTTRLKSSRLNIKARTSFSKSCCSSTIQKHSLSWVYFWSGLYIEAIVEESLILKLKRSRFAPKMFLINFIAVCSFGLKPKKNHLNEAVL